MNGSCYCNDRATNPELDVQMKSNKIPEGFCGLCCVCKKPGHTCAHPRRPYTSSWCEEHWQEVLQEIPISPIQILIPLIILIGGFVYWYVR